MRTVDIESLQFIRDGEVLPLHTSPTERMRWTGRNSTIEWVFAFEQGCAVVHGQRDIGPTWEIGQPIPMNAFMSTYAWGGHREAKLQGLVLRTLADDQPFALTAFCRGCDRSVLLEHQALAERYRWDVVAGGFEPPFMSLKGWPYQSMFPGGASLRCQPFVVSPRIRHRGRVTGKTESRLGSPRMQADTWRG